MNVFYPGGTSISVGSNGTVTLNGVGDVIRVVPVAPSSGVRVNEVNVPANGYADIFIGFDATTVEVDAGSPCRIVRGTVR